MKKILIAFILMGLAVPSFAQKSYRIEKVEDGVFAALSLAGGEATSNAFFVVGDRYVYAGGAHMTKEAIADLTACIAETTEKPLRYFILAHHHKGLTFVDFDFPPDVQVIMSRQTWKVLSAEKREVSYLPLFFDQEISFRTGNDQSIIISNLGENHTEGDVIVYLPETKTLFSSDLVYADSVGYMGEGFMEKWVLTLELLENLQVRRLVPGFGPVGSIEEISGFKAFFKDFLTEIIRHLERGDSLERTLKTFSLPKYEEMPGYKQFLPANVERAYLNLKEAL